MTAVIAITKSFGIGKDNRLPWHVPDDLKHFKRVTLGHNLIVGRKTADTLPKLANRNVIIVSRSGKSLEKAMTVEDPYIIGGREIYLQCLEKGYIETIICTHLNLDVECNVFMPHDFLDGFTSVDEVPLSDGHVIVTYKRNNPKTVAFV